MADRLQLMLHNSIIGDTPVYTSYILALLARLTPVQQLMPLDSSLTSGPPAWLVIKRDISVINTTQKMPVSHLHLSARFKFLPSLAG
jgi:hypothetical protein